MSLPTYEKQTVNKPISHLLTSSAFVLRPFAGSSLHLNQNLKSSYLSSDGIRPRNEAPGISASVRIESHAAIAVAMLEMHDARGLSGFALVFVVTIPPERSAIMKVVYRGFARQSCCMAETIEYFCYG